MITGDADMSPQEGLAATCAATARVIETDLGVAGNGAMRVLMIAAYANRLAARALVDGDLDPDAVDNAEAVVRTAGTDVGDVEPATGERDERA